MTAAAARPPRLSSKREESHGCGRSKHQDLPWSLWERATWDQDKDRRNIAKHGVSLREAETVLVDPLAVLGVDTTHSTHEDRFRLIGTASTGRLLVVIVAADARGTIRLVSARRPTRRERHEYEDR